MFSLFSSPVPVHIRLKSPTMISLPKYSKQILKFLICGTIVVFLVIASVHISDSNNSSMLSNSEKHSETSLFNIQKRKREVSYSKIDRLISKPKKSAKILCYILLSRRKLIAAQIIKNTWGKHCDKLLFYGRFNNSDLPVTFLNTTEGYEYLWGKTKSAIIHLEQHFSMSYDWFLKADDDTFVIFENLRDYIQEMELHRNKPVWFGYKLRHNRMKEGYMSGGAGYVFSTSALSKLVLLLQTGETDDNSENKRSMPNCDISGKRGIEDLELGKCFLAAGVEDVSTVDLQGRERFLPLPLSALLNGDISSFHWIWRQAWNPLKTGDKCCSSKLISLHQITPYEMKNLYFLIYKLKLDLTQPASNKIIT